MGNLFSQLVSIWNMVEPELQYIPFLIGILQLIYKYKPNATMGTILSYIEQAEALVGMTGEQKKAWVLSKLGLTGDVANMAGVLIDELISLINQHNK